MFSLVLQVPVPWRALLSSMQKLTHEIRCSTFWKSALKGFCSFLQGQWDSATVVFCSVSESLVRSRQHLWTRMVGCIRLTYFFFNISADPSHLQGERAREKVPLRPSGFRKRCWHLLQKAAQYFLCFHHLPSSSKHRHISRSMMLSRKCSPSHPADLLPKMIPTGSRLLNGYSVPQRETSSSKFPPSQYSTNRWKDELVSCAEDALHMKSNNTLIWCAKTNCTTQKTEKLEVQVIPRWLACSWFLE